MSRMTMGSKLLLRAAIFPTFGSATDAVRGETPTEKLLLAESTEESGRDRLLRVLKPDEFGKLSPEVETVLQVGCMSMFVGAIYGGVIQSRGAYMEFFKNNQATVFKDHLEAKKRLQDKVTLSFGKGALRWGWRLTLFTTTYMGISTLISVYRGKNSILEYVVAGTVTGATYKFSMGPRGWIVGGGLGFCLGLVAGGTTLGLLKLTGMRMQDTHYYNSMWRNKRADTIEKGVREHVLKEEMEILIDHDQKLGNTKRDLNDIDIKSSS